MSMRSWVPLVLSAFLVSPLHAAINEVRVVAVNPEVEWRASDKDEWKTVEKDTILQQGHEITCDPDGQVTLAFSDNSTVIIRNTTQLKIGSFFTEGGVVRTELLLKMGEISAKVNKSETTRSDFKIKSPTGTASVRGTELHVVKFDAVRGFEVRLSEGFANVSGFGGTAAVAKGDTAKVDSKGEVKSPTQVKTELLASTAFPAGTTDSEVKQLQSSVTADTGFQASSSAEVDNVSQVVQATTIKQIQSIDVSVDFSDFQVPAETTGQSALITSSFGERVFSQAPFLVITTGGETGDFGFVRRAIDIQAPATLEITFEHKFVTTEDPGAFFAADDVFIAAFENGGTTTQLARDSVKSSVLFPINPATLGRGPMDFPGGTAPDTAFETAPRRTTAVINAVAGPSALTFGVIDAEDTIVESAAAIDNIRVRTVDSTMAAPGISSTPIPFTGGGTSSQTSIPQGTVQIQGGQVLPAAFGR